MSRTTAARLFAATALAAVTLAVAGPTASAAPSDGFGWDSATKTVGASDVTPATAVTPATEDGFGWD